MANKEVDENTKKAQEEAKRLEEQKNKNEHIAESPLKKFKRVWE